MSALISEPPRKNGWQIAEYVGHATPDRTQRLLNDAVWDHDAAQGVVRRFVVQQLCDLGSDDLPVAAAAQEALADSARTDIRNVAEAATSALTDAALRVEETDLQFGRVRQRADPPRRTIHLLGLQSPRTSTSQASHTWLTVEASSGGFDVLVDTSVAGRRQGSVTITGPTGEVTIPVDVEITGSPTEEQPRPSSEQGSTSEPAPADTVEPTSAGTLGTESPAEFSTTTAEGQYVPPPAVGRPMRTGGILAMVAAVLLVIGLLFTTTRVWFLASSTSSCRLSWSLLPVRAFWRLCLERGGRSVRGSCWVNPVCPIGSAHKQSLAAVERHRARRTMKVMTELTVELDDATVERLRRRAQREGVEPAKLAAQLVSTAAAEPGPFDFVGSFASDAVVARDADTFLEEHGFGQS